MSHCWSHQLWITEKKLHSGSQNLLLANRSKAVVLNGDVQCCIMSSHLEHVSLPRFRKKSGQGRKSASSI